MNWEAIGAIGEIVSAIAVVITLVYLSIQLRQTRSLMERTEKLALSQVHSQRAMSRQTQELAIASTDHLAPIWAKIGSENGDVDSSRLTELTADERVRLVHWVKYQVTHFDNLLYQYELGLISEESFNMYLSAARRCADISVELGLHIPPRLQRFRDQRKEGGT